MLLVRGHAFIRWHRLSYYTMRKIDVEMFRDAHRAFQIFRGPIMLLLEKKLAIHFIHDAIQDGLP